MSSTKKKIDSELQGLYRFGKIWAALVSKRWGVKLISNTVDRFSKGKEFKGLDCQEKFITSNNGGPDIRIRIFKPKNSTGPLPGMLYTHGGGYMFGTPEMYYEDAIKQFIKKRPCIIVAPDYRKSLKNPYPDGFNDCYDTLLWMNENESQLGMVPNKYIIMGYSAGGGMTAAVTSKAVDTGDVNIAFQMPFYPMLDDRQNTKSALTMVDVPSWNAKNSKFAWGLYLKNLREANTETPKYAAPARNTSYTNFPPTITFVGEMDPFRDETINYINALKKHNIPVKFKLLKGAFHGFETMAPKAKISVEANAFQLESFAEYYDIYFN